MQDAINHVAREAHLARNPKFLSAWDAADGHIPLALKQALSIRRRVRKGERGSHAIKIVESDNDGRRLLAPRAFTVFAAAQTDASEQHGAVTDPKASRIIEEHVPAQAQTLFARAQCLIKTLEPHELYKDRSAALSRLQIDVDAWPVPPAGLFVVEERTIYLRRLDPMTVVHEYGHAIDCALGSGVYFSGICPSIRKAFAEARDFVTPYAATGVDEFFAECFRAWCRANSESSAWPRVSRERLGALHPIMFELFAQRFG